MTQAPGPRGPDDVVAVTGGQDRGARFGLRGSEATIGRGPVMDIVLSDPRISRRHAVLRRTGATMLIADLGSTSGIIVNGAPIAGPTALVPGDRVVIGETELTVLGPQDQAPPPPPPPPPPPAAAPATPPAPPPTAAPGPEHHPLFRTALVLPIACIALGVFAFAGTWMPVFGNRAGTDSIWSLGFSGLRAQAILSALLVIAAATAWLRGVSRPAQAWLALPSAVITALSGGLVAGLPLLLAAVHVESARREAGVPLLSIAGLAVAGCAIAGVVLLADPPPRAPSGALPLVAGGAGTGALLAVVAAPLTWLSLGDLELSGFDGDLAAGGWLIPIALAAGAAGGLAYAVARAGEPRAALGVATGACAAAAVAFTFVTTTAVAFQDFQMEIGLSLALTGVSLALVCATVGTLAAVLTRPGD